MPGPLTEDSALFLDIDGTLIDLAATPDAVRVPAGLPERLRRIKVRLGGALAILSGRRLGDIDRLLGPDLACAAEHGAVLRWPDGRLEVKVEKPAAYENWLKILTAQAARMPGVLIEEKAFSLVVHYRQAPQFEPALSQLVNRLIGASDDAVLLLAHCAFELKPRGGNKGDALAAFMQIPVFHGRRPVFIGDDITDEPAIQKAAELGGLGLHVVRDFGGKTESVRDWLFL